MDETKTICNFIIVAKKDLLHTLVSNYYKETKAPQGYILDSNEYEFNITKDAQVRKITFKNEAKKLPQTGGFISTNMLIVIIVTVVSVVGYIVITLVTKNKENV